MYAPMPPRNRKRDAAVQYPRPLPLLHSALDDKPNALLEALRIRVVTAVAQTSYL